MTQPTEPTQPEPSARVRRWLNSFSAMYDYMRLAEYPNGRLVSVVAAFKFANEMNSRPRRTSHVR